MKKLTLEHSEAASAAKAQLIHLLDREAPPRWRTHIERQIELMGEVNWHILHSIYNPGLPFGQEVKSNGPADGG